MGLPGELFPRIGTPFGAGLGRAGELCGVVSGALMGIGLLLGRDDDGSSKEPAYEEARRFVARFRARFGAVACPALIGFDLGRPEERRRAQEAEVGRKKCRVFLEWAAAYLGEILEQPR